MRLSFTILLKATHAQTIWGSAAPLQADDAASKTRTLQASPMFASSHTIAQRQPAVKPFASHMYASSHTLLQEQVTAGPELNTSVHLMNTVDDGMMTAMTAIPSNIAITSILGNARGIIEEARITTVTSAIGPTVAKSKPTSTESTIADPTMTTIVDEIATVTSFPLFGIPVPQSQVQGPVTTEPSLVTAPIATATSTLGPSSLSPINPHIVTSASGYTYIGCFREGLEARALGEAFFPNDLNTVEKCAAACFPYHYAGVEFGRECWCGNSMAEAITKIGEESCNMPCVGDGAQFCGGIVALNVYIRGALGESSSVPGSGYQTSIPAPNSRSTSHIATSTSASSAASTGLASIPSLLSSLATLSNSSDPGLLTASSESSQITSSVFMSTSIPTITVKSGILTASSRIITSIFSSTSSQAVPIHHDTSTVASHTTRYELTTIYFTELMTLKSNLQTSFTPPSRPSKTFTIKLSASSITTARTSTPLISPSPGKSSSSSRATPTLLFPTSKEPPTSTITIQPRPLSLSIEIIITAIPAVTQSPLHTATPLSSMILPANSTTSLLSTPKLTRSFTYARSTHSHSSQQTTISATRYSTQSGVVLSAEDVAARKMNVNVVGGLAVLLAFLLVI